VKNLPTSRTPVSAVILCLVITLISINLGGSKNWPAWPGLAP
jgi:hypothetical protein